MEAELKLPPHIKSTGFGSYVNEKTGRTVGNYKIKSICDEYWQEHATELDSEPEQEPVVDGFLENVAKEFYSVEVEKTEPIIYSDDVDINQAAKTIQKGIDAINKTIMAELDMVIGQWLAKESNLYWPKVKSSVEIDTTGDEISPEKHLAIIAFGIHKHYPFNDRILFIAAFCNRSIEVIKNYIAYRYKYSTWFESTDADIGCIDYDVENEVSEYFAKFYELKDENNF